MKILICGASGNTGTRLVEAALKAGYKVAALVRDPAKLTVRNTNLELVVADLCDRDAVMAAFPADLDAVITVVGVFAKKPSTVVSDGTANLIAAMEKAGVKRLVCVSTWGAGGTDQQAPLFLRLFAFKYLFRHTVADRNRQEDLLRASGLDWTILRPAGLTDEDPLGETYCWSGDRPKQAKRFKVSRAWLADYCLNCLEDQSAIGAEINLSE